jgi:hypothetical protein
MRLLKYGRVSVGLALGEGVCKVLASYVSVRTGFSFGGPCEGETRGQRQPE